MRGPLGRRSPPAGTRFHARSLLRVLRQGAPAHVLSATLRRWLGDGSLALFDSGREALRVLFTVLAESGDRCEIVIPAYCCYSIPAAAVAAGLRVRLVDVELNARIDLDALDRLPSTRVVAVVVCNLFGLPEPVGEIRAWTRAAGADVVDDAAQALGACDADGPVGARGRAGVLSFARGKPLAGLGGGALFWSDPTLGISGPPVPAPARSRALLRALAYNVALSPHVFPWLESIPSLRIGETTFDPDFTRGAIDGPSLALAASCASEMVEMGQERARAAEAFAKHLADATPLRPLVADERSSGVYPRLALVAPDRARRDAAISVARSLGIGASQMYPASLDQVAALTPHLAPGPACPGAQQVAERLLTLPVPPRRGLRRLDALRRALGGL